MPSPPPVLRTAEGGTSMVAGVLSMVGSLVLIVLVLILTYYATRWYARRAGRQAFSGKYVRVLDRSPLDAGASAVIVEVSGRYYLLGVGDKQVNLLCELTDFVEPEAPDPPGTASFSQGFRQALDKARQSFGKGGEPRP